MGKVHAAGIGASLLRQCRKPDGWLGRVNLWRMNRSHSELTDWALRQIEIAPGAAALDVGCGGGRTVQKLAAIASRGRVCGVDFSETSVAASRRLNRRSIENGRVEIAHGSVSHLPFADGTFDVVTAVETHYYWPDLPADLREVGRVLKPGGTFVIIAESYKGGRHDRIARHLDELTKIVGFAHLTVDEHRRLLADAAYADVRVAEDRERGWLCAIGRKPDPQGQMNPGEPGGSILQLPGC